MNLNEPITSVVPGAHGLILQAIAKTKKPLTARQVALLTEGGTTKRRANDVLQELTEAGIVLRQDSAPSYLYTLNHDHVAADSILELSRLRDRLIIRIEDHVAGWLFKPVAVFLFGSTAKGTATERSDVDLLVVRPPNVEELERVWGDQLSQLSEDVHRWSGNYCEILELTPQELKRDVMSEGRLSTDLHRYGRVLYGKELAPNLLSRLHAWPSE